ncbi:hypothetical protein ColTof3_08483 [Colletotrichum tofieldiae]|nr:hypothetical protein ColTof3_08483 [Colletotrichum tofieldiae]
MKNGDCGIMFLLVIVSFAEVGSLYGWLILKLKVLLSFGRMTDEVFQPSALPQTARTGGLGSNLDSKNVW